jgi:hypothetical protein
VGKHASISSINDQQRNEVVEDAVAEMPDVCDSIGHIIVYYNKIASLARFRL